MKRSTIIKIVIVTVLLILVGIKWYTYKNPDSKLNDTAVLTSTIKQDITSQQKTQSTNQDVTINVSKPVNGTFKGVVEVGASGFNSFVINVDKNKNWELVSKEFGESLAYEGFATIDDVQKGLKKYLSNMFDKGVAGRNAYFVMSSGALKNPKTELIAKAIEKMGYIVNRVTPEQEGKYIFMALLPEDYRKNSFVVDIGSGNTKISYYDDKGKLKSLEGYGAKYYQNKTTDQQAYNSILELVKKVPQSRVSNCFIVGGVPFKLANETRKGDNRFTLLKNPDFYSSGDDIKLKSGINIYRAIYDGAEIDNVIFDYDANFTIGFLLTLN